MLSLLWAPFVTLKLKTNTYFVYVFAMTYIPYHKLLVGL